MEAASFSQMIPVAASPAVVWHVLTQRMSSWLADTFVDVEADWQPGGRIVMRGDHGGLKFENRGKVLRFEPEQLLEYTFWSDISEQPDEPQYYSVIFFGLANREGETQLTFRQTNLTTYEILKHNEMYWNVTLTIIRRLSEQSGN